MPELPEVETLRRSLFPHLLGVRITAVRLHRPDVVTGPRTPRALLAGDRITDLSRRGKQMALTAESGRAIVVQLGMTGQMLALPTGTDAAALTHTHVVWQTERGTLIFRDPRRFGGLTTLASLHDLDARFNALGPDALAIDGDTLADRLRGSRRPIKAALLDQQTVAGIGNIYADEALFRARLGPRFSAAAISRATCHELAACIRAVLAEAVRAGGSTLRDYRSADGAPGSFATDHAVYGRAGLPCITCGAPLRRATVAQRTTVWCPRCQGRGASRSAQG
ncbi:MAG: bifunctional DNA-formamidopyrimidine glycosylase/DNA-(apurinic or apyrimidinic site) lyase [Phycisphaerales bacterium]